MTDNTTIQSPSNPGDVISTEDVGGVKIPRNKIVLGAHDVDGGDVTTSNPFPVNVIPSPNNVLTVFNTFNTSGDHSLVSAVVSQVVTVFAYRIQATNAASAVNTVFFEDTTGTPVQLSMKWDLNTREGVVVTAPTGSYEFKSGSGKGVQINLSASQPITIMIQYTQG